MYRVKGQSQRLKKLYWFSHNESTGLRTFWHLVCFPYSFYNFLIHLFDDQIVIFLNINLIFKKYATYCQRNTLKIPWRHMRILTNNLKNVYFLHWIQIDKFRIKNVHCAWYENLGRNIRFLSKALWALIHI